MRFLLDHDVPDDIVFALSALGHEVDRLRELVPATTRDEDVLRLAADRDGVLITCNRDDFLTLAGGFRHAGSALEVPDAAVVLGRGAARATVVAAHAV